MKRLERMNEWCSKFMDSILKYNDLITFSLFALLALTCLFSITAFIVGVLK